MSTDKLQADVLKTYGYVRLNNTPNAILEKRLATLEGGIEAVVTASGAAAIAVTLLTLLKSGDHIVASNSLHNETYNLLKVTLPRLGITAAFVDADDAVNFRNAAKENTRVFFAESVGSVKLDVIDLKAVSAVAKSFKVPFIVDNTNASPYLLNPIQSGANIVIHSLDKYIAANGTAAGGVIIDAGTFDWTNGKFPEFTETSPVYDGLIYQEVFQNASFITKARIEGLRDFGAVLSPLTAFQIAEGLESLPARILRHSWNALELAQWLEVQEEVAWVNYPGLKSGKYHDLANTYLPDGQSGVLAFGLKEGFEAAKIIAEETRLFSDWTDQNGQTKSFIHHPAGSIYQQFSAGVSKDLIQLSIGLEDVEDLKADLKQAFENIKTLNKVLK